MVDLALAYSLSAGKEPDATCRFNWTRGLVPGGISLSPALTPWLPELLVGSLTGGLLLIFLFMRSLPSGGGRLMFLVQSLFTPFGLPVGLTRLIGLGCL